MKRFSSLAMIVAVSTLICMTTVGISTAGATEDYWVWENPTPTGNDLFGVSAFDANHVWAVGANGTILFYDGTRWNTQISPTTNNLNDVWAVSASDVWAVGDSGTIIHYDGSGWSISSAGLTEKDLKGISGCDATNLWAVGNSGTVLRYGGTNWVQDSTFISSKNLYCVTVLDPTHVWCAGPKENDGTGGHIYKWESAGWALEHTRGEPVQGITSLPGNYVWTVGDWGEVSERAPDGTWHDYELTLRTYIRGVSALAPDKVFMVGNDGFIYRGPIPGVDRFIPVDKMGQRLFDVDMLDALHGWAVGTNGTILFHNGIGWSNQHANVNKDLQGVSALSGSSAWAVGNSGNILHYDGSEWVTQESGTDQDLYDVCALDSSHVWTVGKNTVLFNDGSAWSVDESAKFTAKGISGTGSDFVLAAGGFEIHRYNGTKWEFERLSLHILNDVYAFNQNNTNYAWAVGNKGHALFYNGHTWQERSTGDPFERNLLGVYASDSDHAWAVGAEGTIYEYNAGVWTDHSWPASYNLHDISGNDASHIWAAGDGGTILYFNGSGWQQQHDSSAHLMGISVKDGNIALAVGSNETILQFDFDKSKWNDVSPSHSSQKLLSVSAADAANVWAVGENGAILYYDGFKWTDQESGTTRHLRGVSAFDASHVWAVGDGGTILFYNGMDWMPQNNTTVTKNIYGVAAVATDGVCAVGDGYTWFYNGSGWSATGSKFNGKGVAGTDRNHFWAVDGDKDVWIYDSGTWNQHKGAADNHLRGISAVAASGGDRIWAVGDSGCIAFSTDGGTNWFNDVSGTTVDLKAVSMLDADRIWAVGEAGTILRRGGSGWENQISTTQHGLNGVSALAAHSVWAVGDKGTYDTVLAAYPGIEWCSPQSVPRGQTLEVNIVGGNTHFREGDSSVNFSGSGIIVDKTTVTDARHITATITIAGDADTTSRDVNVVTGGEVPYAMANALTIYDLSITKVSPTAGVWGETGLDVNIYGNGTAFDETSYAEFIPASGSNDITVNSTTYVSATEVVANIDIAPGASEKKYDVQVLTPGEQFAPVPLSEGFTIYDSRISQVDPPDFSRGHTIDVEITGYETQFIDGQSTATFDPPDNITVNSTTVTDATHATASITIDAGASATARDVNVTTTTIPDPHPLTEGFTVRDPVISSTSPDSGVQGQWMAFDIYGEDTAFLNGQSYTTFDPPDGIAIIGTAVENPTHAVVGIIIAEDAPTTPRTVNVITPCAGVPNEETPQPLVDGFTVMPNTPHIDSLSQASGAVGTEILVQGYNFGFIQGISFITFNGTQATEYTYWTKEEVGVKVPAGATTGLVTVTTIHGVSNGVNFTVTPAIDSLDPTLGPVGTEVTVTGTTFGDTQDTSYVSFNGTQATAYTSWADGQIVTTVPSGATSGPVTVTTPDGTSNGVEFTVTHSTWYFAEGCTTDGFETWILVENPNTVPVKVYLAFYTMEGLFEPAALQGWEVPAETRVTFNAGAYIQATHLSTVVSAEGGQIFCERSMYGGGRTWGHNSIGATYPASTWYLAEGCTEGGMETWILVQNPNAEPVEVELEFQTESGKVQGPRETLPGHTRCSFNAAEFVQSYDVSTLINASGGIICERSMYGGDRAWGHNSIGTPMPSQTWYLAEGCTEGGMETWVLVQNPGDKEVEVELRFHTGEGEVEGPVGIVPAHSRRSYRINDFVTSFHVSTLVTASGDVVCERSMYGTPQGQVSRTWGHNSIGITAPGNAWHLAEGCTEGGMETFILVQNPSGDVVEVELIFRTESGEVQGPIKTLPAHSRFTFNLGEFVKSYNVSTVVSAGGEVVCERSMYGTPQGQVSRTWAHNSIGFAP